MRVRLLYRDYLFCLPAKSVAVQDFSFLYESQFFEDFFWFVSYPLAFRYVDEKFAERKN